MTTNENSRTEEMTTELHRIEVQESDEKIDTNTPVHHNNNMTHKSGAAPLNGKIEKGRFSSGLSQLILREILNPFILVIRVC